MELQTAVADRVQYAAFKLRFRALIFDGLVCLALFIVGGLTAGIVLENSVGGRVAAFAVILIAIEGYEPFMVARYGGTFGHRRSNIRIVCATSDENLPFWRAVVRSVTKQLLGIFSFVFMFVTTKAQGFHDLLAGARVIVRDPQIADPSDFFEPGLPPSGQAASGTRRVGVILAYNVVFFFLFSLLIAVAISSECAEEGICTGTENAIASGVGWAWLLVMGVSVVLGWTGRLPGCRPRGAS